MPYKTEQLIYQTITIMKRFLMTYAALLLVSMSVFAQNSTPLKGDVNEDGVVNVADIVAIIGIMKNEGGLSGLWRQCHEPCDGHPGRQSG